MTRKRARLYLVTLVLLGALVCQFGPLPLLLAQIGLLLCLVAAVVGLWFL